MLQGWLPGAILGRGIWPLFPSHCLALMEGSWRPEIYYLKTIPGGLGGGMGTADA